MEKKLFLARNDVHKISEFFTNPKGGLGELKYGKNMNKYEPISRFL